MAFLRAELQPICNIKRLLRLVESLSHKIAQIDATGFLDASVLGETVHPRNFNTLRRIRDEDGSVVQEQEEFIELASSEFMLQQLKSLLASGAKDRLDSLADGIHSGLYRAGCRGLFFYFTAPDPSASDAKQHFWRYYDLPTKKITDNRFTIASLIACAPDTPRFLGEADVFAIQEKVKESILESIQTQVAMEAAPKIVDPIQQTVSAVLRRYLNNPKLQRNQVRQALKILAQPMIDAAIRKIKSAYEMYQSNKDESALLIAILVVGNVDEAVATSTPPARQISADDLHLICWEYIWS